MTDRYYRFFKLFTRMSKAIHSGSNLKEIIETIVAQATDMTRAYGAIFWITRPPQKKIQSFISHGFAYLSLTGVDYDTLVRIFRPDCVKEIFIEDARYDERIPNLERLGKKRIKSVVGINLDITREYSGILAIYFASARQLSDDEIELIHALGEQGAIALHKVLSYDGHMVKMLQQMVEALVLAIEARDETTHGHSIKVARLARQTARKMGLAAEEVETIFHAGLLHDIGKIGLGDAILDRLGTLSKKEMDLVRRHPLIGADIVKPLTFLSGLEPIIRHHHERYDGSGYPAGLKGEAIPLGARIVCACDVFETMISGRRHIRQLHLHHARSALINGAGRHYDPHVVDALLAVIENGPAWMSSRDSTENFLLPGGKSPWDAALESLKDPCLTHPICF
jgi:putative nucleotidyltransferase with HDIG domain